MSTLMQTQSKMELHAPILNVTQATKSYGQVKALDGIDFQLNRGERRALLGPNGAGKTTLIRSMVGRVKLDSGGVQWQPDGINPGFVPQEIALYPLMTARENLSVFGRLNGLGESQIPQRVEEILKWIGLENRANDPCGRFSGGMKRRLNIGCAVMHHPEVVLLDEPTVGVDPQSRELIWEMLQFMNDRGTTLLVTTHMLDEAEQLCDHISIMDHGKSLLTGSMNSIIENTLGFDKRLSLKIDKPIKDVNIVESTNNDCLITYTLKNIGSELSTIIHSVNSQGAKILDIQIKSPSLHQVFIHLTGRDLRDD